MKKEKISAFEPATFILGIILAVLSAIICMQIIGKMGVTPNTSIIGAIVALVLARIPLSNLKKFRNLERQNYIQTIVSGAGFSAANCAFLGLGIFYVMNEKNFMMPMAIGICLGVVVSICIVGKLFDSTLFPAQGAWPPGVATANTLQAGDEGGDKGKRLIQGIILGAVGSYFKLPAAGIGIVFIANIFSMTALGIGLIIRGYAPQLLSIDLGQTYIPHGIMIGAGLMALIQSIKTIASKDESKTKDLKITVNSDKTRKALIQSIVVYLVTAVIIAVITGVVSRMSVGKLILWVIWATFSAFVAMLLVGQAAMHSGWFPAFAITTIFMTIGIFLGFDIVSIAVLTGFVSAVGPCFADMGYDLKTGWIIRGEGEDVASELYGRRQQVLIEIVGGVIGVIVVVLSMNMYFEQDLMPPVSKVFATTIGASVDTAMIKELLMWSIPGIIIQLVGGSSKMLGVLFATGLLINNPIYGIGLIIAVIIRMIFGTEFMEVRDAGLIAGDGLFGFFAALIQSIF